MKFRNFNPLLRKDRKEKLADKKHPNPTPKTSVGFILARMSVLASRTQARPWVRPGSPLTAVYPPDERKQRILR